MAKKDKGTITGEPVTYQIPAPAGGVQMETFIPWTLVKRGVRRQVITPIDAPEQFQSEATAQRRDRKAAKDSPLIRALGLAHFWQRLLDDGTYRSLTDIAAIEEIDLGRASRIVQLCELAPALTEICLADSSPSYTLKNMSRRRSPRCWKKQLDELQSATT